MSLSSNAPTTKPQTSTRAELLDAVYSACALLSRREARLLFEMTIEEIASALVNGESVKLVSFGLFSIQEKRERIGRNPRTGEEVVIKPRRVLKFKPSPRLISKLNSEFEDSGILRLVTAARAD